MYYVITDCVEGTQIVTVTDLSLSGIAIGDFFHIFGTPNSCFQLLNIGEGNPPIEPTPVTVVGPVFGTCTECLNAAQLGCTDPRACNFNPCATADDKSCFYNNVTIKILCDKPLTNCNINSNCN